MLASADGQAPRPLLRRRRGDESAASMRALGDVARSPLGEQPLEGVLNARRGTVGHEDGREMRSADDELPAAASTSSRMDRQPEILQSLQEQIVSLRRSARSPRARTAGVPLRARRSSECVHRPGRERARDSQPGTNPMPRLLARSPARATPRDRRGRSAPSQCSLRLRPARRLSRESPAVGARRVHVQVDHSASVTDVAFGRSEQKLAGSVQVGQPAIGILEP